MTVTQYWAVLLLPCACAAGAVVAAWAWGLS